MPLRLRATRVLVGVLLLLSASTPPAGAFDYDTHYLWTYYLAMQVGYSPRQAYQIASATFAVDYDRDTEPMGADKMQVLQAAPDAATEAIWTRFHAFADARYSQLSAVNPTDWKELIARSDARIATLLGGQVDEIWVARGDPAMVRQLRDQNAAELWQLALEEGNPGPYLHFLQDTFSHWDFDSRRGHLAWSHVPDFLSYDVARSREMTTETLRALQRFAASQGIATREPNMERVWEVLDALIAANPPVWADDFRYTDELQQFGLDQIKRVVDPQIHAMFPKASGVGSPQRPAAWRVVTAAIDEDRRANRLPAFPDAWFQQDVPARWFQYDFDADGRTGHAMVNRTRFPVEWPEIVIGDARLICTPEPDTADLVRLTLRVPYELRGAAPLDFQQPLPVYETSVLSDSGEQKPGTLERENGHHEVVRYVLRSRASLAAQPATWTESIAVGPGNERAVVQTPLTCEGQPVVRGTPQGPPGPAHIACPPSPSGRAVRYGTADDGDAPLDGTHCPPTARGTWCHVKCVYEPSPQSGGDQLDSVVTVEWAIDLPPEELARECDSRPRGGMIRESYSVGLDARSALGPLGEAADPHALTCPGRAATGGLSKTSWLRPATTLMAFERLGYRAGTGEVVPPDAPGPTRMLLDGQVLEALYELQADPNGVPIDLYFYRTPTPPGGPVPEGDHQWSRFVRQPAARSGSNEPVVWWHAHWEWGKGGWEYVQERGVAPPRAVP